VPILRWSHVSLEASVSTVRRAGAHIRRRAATSVPRPPSAGVRRVPEVGLTSNYQCRTIFRGIARMRGHLVLGTLCGVLACSSGCLFPHDSETPPPRTIEGSVIHWKVVDEASGTEITSGCGGARDKWKKIRFAAAPGARVVETVLYERIEKRPDKVGSFPSVEADDAFWCSTQDDVRRDRPPFIENLDCARPSPLGSPGTIVARQVIPTGPGMGGYRLTLEIQGPGVLMYEYDASCSFSWNSELTVIAP